MEYDFRLDVNRGIQPRNLLFFELDLLLIDRYSIWVSGEVLVVVLGVRLVLIRVRLS